MKKKTKKILFVILIFVFVLAIFNTATFAGDKINPESYHHKLNRGEGGVIFQKGGYILKVLRNIAAITSVVTITIIGIRYMLGSVDQKAEYKEKMLPVVIGCFLIVGLAGILTLIQSIMS